MSSHVHFRSVGLATTVLAVGALTALAGGPLGSFSIPTASAQVPYMIPGPMMGPEVTMMVPSPVVGMTMMPTMGMESMSGSVSLNPGADYLVPGQYCMDKSGGDMFIPEGAPTEGLSCGSGMGGAMDTNGMPATSNSAMPASSSSGAAAPSSPSAPAGGDSGGY